MCDDPTLVILTRARGRPVVDPPTCPVSTRLPEPDVDRLIRLAARHDVPVAALMRAMLQVALRRFEVY